MHDLGSLKRTEDFCDDFQSYIRSYSEALDERGIAYDTSMVEMLVELTTVRDGLYSRTTLTTAAMGHALEMSEKAGRMLDELVLTTGMGEAT